MSLPTRYPTQAQATTKKPVWASAALKGLYRDRSLDTPIQPSGPSISRLRRMFKEEAVADDRLSKWRAQLGPQTKNIEKRARWKVIKPYGERRDSEVVRSTGGTVRSRKVRGRGCSESEQVSEIESSARGNRRSSCGQPFESQLSDRSCRFSMEDRTSREETERRTSSQTALKPSPKPRPSTVEQQNEMVRTFEMPGARLESNRSDARSEHSSLNVTKIATKDVAVSMGIQIVAEAAANASTFSAKLVDERTGDSTSSHSSTKRSRSSKRSQGAAPQSLSITGAQKEAATLSKPIIAPDTQARVDPGPKLRVDSENAPEGVHEPAYERQRDSRMGSRPTRAPSSSSRRHASDIPLHGNARGHATAQDAASSALLQEPTSTGHPRPHRVSLNSLHHLSRKDSHQDFSSGSARALDKGKKKKKEKKQIEYHFDSGRRALIRTGLYDEEYRPKEEGCESEPDLWRKLWHASIWKKLAGLVLW